MWQIIIAIGLLFTLWWILTSSPTPESSCLDNKLPNKAHLLTRRVFVRFTETIQTKLSLIDVSQLSTVLSYFVCAEGTLDVDEMLMALEIALKQFPQMCSILNPTKDSVNLQTLANSTYDCQILDLSECDIEKYLPQDLDTVLTPTSIFSPNLSESIKGPLSLARITFFKLNNRPKTMICLNVNHAVCDGEGMFHFLSSWSSFSRGKKAIKIPAHSRHIVDRIESHPVYVRKAKESDACFASPVKLSCLWISGKITPLNEDKPFSLKITQESIDRLKEKAFDIIPRRDPAQAEGSRFLSSNDIVSAFICKVISKSFQKEDLDDPFGLSIVVNCKDRIGVLEKSLFGNAFAVVPMLRLSKGELQSISFEELCWLIRKEMLNRVNEMELSHHLFSAHKLMQNLLPYLSYIGFLVKMISVSSIRFGDTLIVSNLSKSTKPYPIDFGTGPVRILPVIGKHRGYIHGTSTFATEKSEEFCWSGRFTSDVVRVLEGIDIQALIDSICSSSEGV